MWIYIYKKLVRMNLIYNRSKGGILYFELLHIRIEIKCSHKKVKTTLRCLMLYSSNNIMERLNGIDNDEDTYFIFIIRWPNKTKTIRIVFNWYKLHAWSSMTTVAGISLYATSGSTKYKKNSTRRQKFKSLSFYVVQ